MASRYPTGLLEYVKANYTQQDTNELVKNVNSKFGTKLSAKAMRSLKKRYNLIGGPRVRVYTKEFPEEVCNYIEKNYKGVGPKAMAEKLSQKFDREYTMRQIKTYYKNHKLNSGLNGQFPKGHVPANKGKKMSAEQYERCKKTMFKKGNVPSNHMKVGDYTHTTDGYLVKKVQEHGIQRERFLFAQRLVWEKYNGPIPPGKVVAFLDGNKDNCNIDNLVLLDNDENLEMNRSRLRSNNAELTKAGVAVAKLKVAVRKKKKERKRQQHGD